MSLRDKMLAVMADVNSAVSEREELVELIAIALLTRKNLFILGDPGQAKKLLRSMLSAAASRVRSSLNGSFPADGQRTAIRAARSFQPGSPAPCGGGA